MHSSKKRKMQLSPPPAPPVALLEALHPSWAPLFAQFDLDIDSLWHPDAPHRVYPARNQVFRVFTMPVEDIRVVLMGGEPYAQEGLADGFSFSVPDGALVPFALDNLLQQVQFEFPDRQYDFGTSTMLSHAAPRGNLAAWFHRERIFLMNAVLTVEHNRPGSNIEEWTEFTDEVVRYIAAHNPRCVFLLLGQLAASKARALPAAVQASRLVVAPHPSPLTAYQGFMFSQCFRKTETLLGEPINWSL